MKLKKTLHFYLALLVLNSEKKIFTAQAHNCQPGIFIPNPTINLPIEVSQTLRGINNFFMSPRKIICSIGATAFGAASLWKLYRSIDNYGHNRIEESKGDIFVLATCATICTCCVFGAQISSYSQPRTS